MCVAWSFIKMEIGKQWSRISIIRSYQRNVYPAGDKSCCLHQWPMEHVLCLYFGFCVCKCKTNCSILIALLLLYFSHCPRSYRGTNISYFLLTKTVSCFVSHSSHVVYVVINFKILQPKLFFIVTNWWSPLGDEFFWYNSNTFSTI